MDPQYNDVSFTNDSMYRTFNEQSGMNSKRHSQLPIRSTRLNQTAFMGNTSQFSLRRNRSTNIAPARHKHKNFLFDFNEKKKVESLEPKKKQFYDLSMLYYGNVLTKVKNIEHVDRIIDEYFEMPRKGPKWSVKKMDSADEVIKEVFNLRLKNEDAFKNDHMLDKELDYIENVYIKELEETMMNNVKSDYEQNKYIYDNHDESLLNDVDKFLHMMPNIAQNAESENKLILNQLGDNKDIKKGLDQLKEQKEEVSILLKQIKYEKTLFFNCLI